jgi:molybdopterin-guanine dinucleotide biosynthesis protein A
MQRDKAALRYHGRTQVEWAHELLSGLCAATFVSVRPDQRDEPTRAAYAQIVDRQPGIGPLAGISAALLEHPKAAWLVVACDLPFLTVSTLQHLVAERDIRQIATAYRSSRDGLPEPLCAIWEPAAREAVQVHLAAGKQCPRKLLINSDCKLIDLPEPNALDNVNTSEELSAAAAALGIDQSKSAASPVTGVTNGPAGIRSADSPDDASLASCHDCRDAGGRATQGAVAELPVASSRGSKALRIQYFAVLREQAGRSEEMIDSSASTPAELFEELRQRHRFQLAPTQLKVALNSEFSDWSVQLKHGDTVVFIPPVAGG